MVSKKTRYLVKTTNVGENVGNVAKTFRNESHNGRDTAKIMELGLMERVGGDHGGTWNVIIKLVTALPIGSMRWSRKLYSTMELIVWTNWQHLFSDFLKLRGTGFAHVPYYFFIEKLTI